MNFDGLKTAVIEMLSGATTQINVNSFQNDMVNFVDKDDVLTLLVHLGYLAYNQNMQYAYIPNETGLIAGCWKVSKNLQKELKEEMETIGEAEKSDRIVVLDAGHGGCR